MSKILAMSTFLSKGRRPIQEDDVLALQDKGIMAVADGFGGGGAGLLASKSACEAIRGFLVKEAGDREATMPFVLRSYFSLAGNILFNALIHANRKVSELNKKKGVHERGGTSVLAAYLDGDLFAMANVGGCQAWLYRGDASAELVIPRTFERLKDPMARSGGSTPLMALGMSEDLEPEIFEYETRPGDWFLLCTEGLHFEARQTLMGFRTLGGTPEAQVQRAMDSIKTVEFDKNVALILVVF